MGNLSTIGYYRITWQFVVVAIKQEETTELSTQQTCSVLWDHTNGRVFSHMRAFIQYKH